MEIKTKAPEGIEIEQKEIDAYIKHIRDNNPNREIKWVNITIDDEGFANLEYELGKVPFDRIRRITGYLVGSTNTWNNAKKSELRDRVKHSNK